MLFPPTALIFVRHWPRTVLRLVRRISHSNVERIIWESGITAGFGKVARLRSGEALLGNNGLLYYAGLLVLKEAVNN